MVVPSTLTTPYALDADPFVLGITLGVNIPPPSIDNPVPTFIPPSTEVDAIGKVYAVGIVICVQIPLLFILDSLTYSLPPTTVSGTSSIPPPVPPPP